MSYVVEVRVLRRGDWTRFPINSIFATMNDAVVKAEYLVQYGYSSVRVKNDDNIVWETGQ